MEEELVKLEQEIQENEAQKSTLETELSKKREVIEDGLLQEAENAFEEYFKQQEETFESIKSTYGTEVN